jgi:FtsZ-binding cell division protein ZapB
MRLTDDQIKMARITYTKVVQDDFILDLIDTIEALQQENEQLKEQINTAKIGWDTYKTYSEQLEQQTVESKELKDLKFLVECCECDCRVDDECPRCQALTAIDALLGGKEDAGKK